MSRNGMSLDEIAHHEAGHTVAALFFDLPFKRVTINPDLDRATGTVQSLGHLLHKPLTRAFCEGLELSRGYPTSRTERQAQNRIITTMAGAIAQERYLIEEGRLTKRVIRRKIRQGSGSDDPLARGTDHDHVMDLLLRLWCGDEVAARHYLRFCEHRSQRFIDWRWQHVKAIAQALVEHKTLTPDQVKEIICKAYGRSA